MTEPQTQFLDVADEHGARRIAFLVEQGKEDGRAGLVWLQGFKSDMVSTKATALAAWARSEGLTFARFDSSGHGQSSGRFEDGTIGAWLAEAEAFVRHVLRCPVVLIGSSMGGWLALLLMRVLGEAQRGTSVTVRGAVLIAPAWDMTETLMWARFPRETRDEILNNGVWYRPSAYGDGPYAITRNLIEEGRHHLIGDASIRVECPLRILHGMQDPDVPWRHSLDLVERLDGGDVQLTLVKDAEHRLSRPQDLALLIRTISTLVGEA